MRSCNKQSIRRGADEQEGMTFAVKNQERPSLGPAHGRAQEAFVC